MLVNTSPERDFYVEQVVLQQAGGQTILGGAAGGTGQVIQTPDGQTIIYQPADTQQQSQQPQIQSLLTQGKDRWKAF